MTEVRIHGRAGQGVLTTASLLAGQDYAQAMEKGRNHIKCTCKIP